MQRSPSLITKIKKNIYIFISSRFYIAFNILKLAAFDMKSFSKGRLQTASFKMENTVESLPRATKVEFVILGWWGGQLFTALR